MDHILKGSVLGNQIGVKKKKKKRLQKPHMHFFKH